MIINYESFSAVDLRVATVISTLRVEGSEKLLKLRVDLGDEQRQIIAGIGKVYSPEDLVNKQIIIVANLEPRSLMGLESQGMLLAADCEDGPVILIPDKPVASGTKIK